MNVFIQNESGSDLKHIHNEKTLDLLETSQVFRAYLYSYGFVITERKLRAGTIVECEPIGLASFCHETRNRFN